VTWAPPLAPSLPSGGSGAPVVPPAAAFGLISCSCGCGRHPAAEASTRGLPGSRFQEAFARWRWRATPAGAARGAMP
jgi:hypothetical protein